MQKTQRIFTAEGESLDGTLYFPQGKGKFPGVVIYHGRGSRKERYTDRAEILAKNGFLTLIFSFRGCGLSSGELKDQTIERGLQDAVLGYDHLANQEQVDQERMGIYGASFGGYLAALVTEKRPVKSLVLAAPAIYKNEWWTLTPESVSDEAEEFRQSGGFSDSIAIQAIRNYSGSLLVIKHERDEVIPERVTSAFFNHATSARKKEMFVLKNAPHALQDKKLRDQSNQVTAEWFKETL